MNRELTKEQVQELVAVRIEALRSEINRIRQALDHAFDLNTASEEGVESVARAAEEWITERLTEYLLGDDPARSIATEAEIHALADSIMAQGRALHGFSFKPHEVTAVREFYVVVVQNHFEMLSMAVPPGKTLLDAFWKWIKAAQTLAVERGVQVCDLPRFSDLSDELIRRTMTRNEFIACLDRQKEHGLNRDHLKSRVIAPFDEIDRVLDDEPRVFGRLDEKNADAKIDTLIERLSTFCDQWNKQETDRIFGST